MNKNKRYVICWFLASTFFCSVLSAKTVVVFVHGTVLPALSILDVSGVRHDVMDDSSRYVVAIKKVRDDQRFWEDQPVLAQGLVPVLPMPLLASEDHTRFAVYPVVQAFDSVARWSGYLDGEVAYYTFGHLGLLSQRYRREQGFALYQALGALVRGEEKVSGEPVRVVIVAHSHGGNIALCMAEAEKELHEDLVIDDLVLFGLPVQMETAFCAYQKPFKRVVNFFSPGDTIQLSDWLSTKSNCSFRTLTVAHKQGVCSFSPPNTSYGRVVDVRCLINSQTTHLTHQNLWHLGRSRPICASMQMMPFVCVAPQLLYLLQSYDNSKPMLIDADVCDCDNHLFCSLAIPDRVSVNMTVPRASELSAMLKSYDHDVRVSWKPTYKNRMLLLYQGDFMREVLGIVSWIDFKIRFTAYHLLKKARQLMQRYVWS